MLVLSPSEVTPVVRLTAYSHIFINMKELAKELDCNIDIACETDPEILQVSASTGIMLVGGKWFCSGNLVNNEMTVAYEPFFPHRQSLYLFGGGSPRCGGLLGFSVQCLRG